MKILEIHIYGYGKLEDFVVKDLSDINVFYGGNESGKSTMMSFIHSILFGFPSKRQPELRYEPKKGTKYGGKLVVYTEETGKAVIERVKGKSAGDVNVLLEDGTVGEEELLSRLLFRIDRNLYESIYSFNLHGLQNVHQLNKEELGRFLFSSGTVGSDKLLTAEKNLQKEMEARFKPNGKKPVINEKLAEIEEVYKQLRKAEMKNRKYNDLLQEKKRIITEIGRIQEKIQLCEENLRNFEEWKFIFPIVKEKKEIESQLASIPPISFPEDGLERLNQLNEMIKPIESQLKALAEKKDRLAKELVKYEPDFELIQHEGAIQFVLEKLAFYDSLKAEEGEWAEKERKILLEIEELKENFQTPLEKEHILQIKTGAFQKEMAKEISEKEKRLQERKIELDRMFNEAKERLESLEGKMADIERKLLPDQERKEKEKAVENSKGKGPLKAELEWVESQISFLEKRKEDKQFEMNRNKWQFFFFAAVFFLLSVFALWKGEWSVAAIGAAGIIFAAYFYWQKGKERGKGDIVQELQMLRTKRKQILEKLAAISEEDSEYIAEQLRADDERRKELGILKIKWDEQNAVYDQVIDGYESWERECLGNKRKGEELLAGLSLNETIPLHQLYDAFLLLEKLKEKYYEWDYIKIQLGKKRQSILSIEEEIRKLKEKFLNDHDLSLKETVFSLKNRLKEELAKDVKFNETKKRLLELNEQLEDLKNEHSYFLNEKKKLFQLAAVGTEEDFRLKGKEKERMELLAARQEELSKQLLKTTLGEKEIGHLIQIPHVEREREKLATELEYCRNEMQQLAERLAEVKHEIELLEEGGVYGELFHHFKLLQSQLNLEAKEWAKYAVAKEILGQTVERFKNERLPKMVKQAEQYLSFLTGGNYRRIIVKNSDEGFFVERKDHLLFEANELSQATMEQLYVSLRIALATTIYRHIPLPIIIDDSFVNFDSSRAKRVIQLLREIKGNQILFFTCHHHLLEHFKEHEVMNLGQFNKSKTVLF